MPKAEAEAIASDAARHLRLGKPEHVFLPSMRVFSAAGATLVKSYSRHWKSITHTTSVRVFNNHLVPYFGDMPIEDTTLQYVHLCDDAVLASAQVVGDAIASREAQNV